MIVFARWPLNHDGESPRHTHHQARPNRPLPACPFSWKGYALAPPQSLPSSEEGLYITRILLTMNVKSLCDRAEDLLSQPAWSNFQPVRTVAGELLREAETLPAGENPDSDASFID